MFYSLFGSYFCDHVGIRIKIEKNIKMRCDEKYRATIDACQFWSVFQNGREKSDDTIVETPIMN